MKRVLLFLVAIIFSISIVTIVPHFLDNNMDISNILSNSILTQKIVSYSDTNIVINKMYDSGKLVGIVSDKEKLYKDIKNINFDTDYEYDRNSIGLKNNIYFVEELSKVVYENIDDEILNYLDSNDYIGINTKCVKISSDGGVFDIIYIVNEEDFINAKNQYILNFISQDSLNKIERGEKIESPISFGSVETGISIKEKTEISNGIASPNEIFGSEEQIYEYLCYGRNTERQYYTTVAGDTVEGIGSMFNLMSAKQIMMINPDIIHDEDQILVPGTVLNVTYFNNSPLTVTVTKENFTQEILFADTEYIKDDSLPVGQSVTDIEAQNGLRYVLYAETWINGELQQNKTANKDENVISYITKTAKIDGKVRMGSGVTPSQLTAGSGNWRWPVATPMITCDYYCYAGHGGVDFYNLYDPWNYVLAIDSGTVEDVGWTDIGGYYVRIDHHNGYVTYYGHFRSMPTVDVGQSVSAGDVLGPIGMTGRASGPHVHLAMYDNGILINPCTVLNCSLLY